MRGEGAGPYASACFQRQEGLGRGSSLQSSGLNVEPSGTTACAYGLFQQPWWLEAVAPGAWDEVRIEQDGRVVARLPYVRKRRCGLKLITQPPLTQYLGPWLKPAEGKSNARLGREISLLQQLIERLPACDLFRMRFAPQMKNYLPFYWAGFEACPRYTYRLEDLTDAAGVWSGLSATVRTQIRKADKNVAIRADADLDRVLDMQELTFKRQGISGRADRHFYHRLDEACIRRDCRRALIAEDARGRLHAAGYFVWDDTSVYYLYGGIHPELKASGAMSLLMWEAIRHAQQVGKAFDFEGSMVPGIERFFRSFGASQVDSLLVWRMSRRLRVGWALRDLAVATLGLRPKSLGGGLGHASV